MPDAPPPSTANIAIACALIAGVTGYFLGQAKSLGLFGGSAISTPAPGHGKTAVDSDSDESSDDDDGTAPSDFPDHSEECKLVLIVRTDLGMTKGLSSESVQLRASLIVGQARSQRNVAMPP